jgi:hypothetical protein
MPTSFAEELRQDGTLVLSPTKLAARLAMSTDELATVANIYGHTISENSTDTIPDKRSARIPDIAYA